MPRQSEDTETSKPREAHRRVQEALGDCQKLLDRAEKMLHRWQQQHNHPPRG